MTTSEAIAIMVERIVAQFHPLRIILFGSQARGDAGPDSDVDLLVVLPAVEHRREITVAIRRVLRDLPVSKDIIVSTPEEIAARSQIIGSVLHPAMQEGKVLYERSAA